MFSRLAGWWRSRRLSFQLATLALSVAVAAALMSARPYDAFEQRTLLFATVLGLVWLTYFRVKRAIDSIVAGAEALVAGEYDKAKLPDIANESREGSELAAAFDRLALAIAEREQIARSEILQLREVEQMKTDFVSTVSHELRTPLTSIRGSLGLVLGALDNEVGPKARALLEIASQNTDRLIRLINDILDIEKIEAGHVTLKTEPGELRAILRTTLTGLEGYATEAGVRLVLEPGVDAIATVDADRLVQVFTNLVSNAIKFSPAGQAVRVRLETEGSLARVLVTDAGPGIPEEFRDKMFGRFQQADRSDSRKKNGTGLGLAIARAIVELHDGSISFESAAGRGTTFVVELPYLPPVGHSRPTPIGGLRLIRAASRTRARPQVLLVEQDAGVIEVLRSLCEPFADLIVARTGEDAFDAIRTSTIDAVIADPARGSTGGPDFVRRMKAEVDDDGTQVLLFSSREFSSAELERLSIPATHAFVKSRDHERQLVLRLRAVLTVRQQAPRARRVRS
jgi:signal transduction histidine kinase